MKQFMIKIKTDPPRYYIVYDYFIKGVNKDKYFKYIKAKKLRSNYVGFKISFSSLPESYINSLGTSPHVDFKDIPAEILRGVVKSIF